MSLIPNESPETTEQLHVVSPESNDAEKAKDSQDQTLAALPHHCLYLIEQANIANDALDSTVRHCNMYVYELECENQGISPLDPQNLTEHLSETRQTSYLRCIAARNVREKALENIQNHPKDCQYRWSKEIGSYCSSEVAVKPDTQPEICPSLLPADEDNHIEEEKEEHKKRMEGLDIYQQIQAESNLCEGWPPSDMKKRVQRNQ